MLKAKIQGKEFEIEFQENKTNKGRINDKSFELDVLNVDEGSFHILQNNISYNAQILKANIEEKTFDVRVNNKRFTIEVADRFDILLKQMGMDNLASAKITELKAPMPGLVLDIVVSGGSQVKKGEPLLVLEAMKMENVLKSPADVTIKSIEVNKGTAVEKNTVLINFE